MNTREEQNEWDVEQPEDNEAEQDLVNEIIANYELKLEEIVDSRNEERFFWVLALVILIDVAIFQVLPWYAAMMIFLLEIILLIGLASHLGVDRVVVLLSRLFDKYMSK